MTPVTGDAAGLVGELAAMIAEAAGEDPEWAAAITATSNLGDDLELESIDMVALATALHTRYGPAVDLIGHLADLDLDQLIELTVGDLAGYVAEAAHLAERT